MPGPHPAVAATRLAVRRVLAGGGDGNLALSTGTRSGDLALPTGARPGELVLAALSGGADSTALAAALAFEAPRRGVRAGAVVVDHGLHVGSADVAHRAAEVARVLGLAPVEVVTVEVTTDGGGLEAAARTARYAALDVVAGPLGATLVLLGHTLDDQAEQVLLGLLRGSGARSLAGMPPANGRLRRPFLQVSAQETRLACQAQQLDWWDDPMNEDPVHTRVRVRRALVDLERDLGPGVAAALARTAAHLRVDADHLDALADAQVATLALVQGRGPWPVEDLRALPGAVRGRVWRRLLVAGGAPPGQVSTRHTDACDRLLTDWHGQGPVHVPGPLAVSRRDGRVSIAPRPPVE